MARPKIYVVVEFKALRKDVFVNIQEFPFKTGDYVIVQAEKGIDFGRVKYVSPELSPESKKQVYEVLRKATDGDLKQLEESRERASRALENCREKAVKHGLEMKVVDAEYQFDRNKLTFYFTAAKRVDFRELVKDLATEYRTRIILRQINAREEVLRFGGLKDPEVLYLSRYLKRNRIQHSMAVKRRS